MRTASSGLRRRRSKAGEGEGTFSVPESFPLLTYPKSTFPSLSNACHAGYPPSRISKSPLFFSWLVMPFKGPFIPLGATFTGQKFYRWYHDNWPIGQWVICHAAPDTAYVNHFFPREIIIWFKSIQVDLETSSLARSLRDLMHWSSLRSELMRGRLLASLKLPPSFPL